VPRENYSDGQSLYALYARLALLIVGWATAGAILYALSTVLPIEVLAMIAIGLGDCKIRHGLTKE
jgi:hypothetical protein